MSEVLAALAVLATAGGIAWRVWGGYGSTPPGRALARREMATLAAAADAIFPRGGALEPSGSDAGVPAYVDRLMAAWPARQRALVRLLLFAVEHATLVLPARAGVRGQRRFSAQPPAAREAWLESWRTSRHFARRLVFTSLRALATLGYLADPAVQRALGFAPRPIDAAEECDADRLYPRVGASCGTLRTAPTP
jgi:hypothetical protein